MNSVTTSSGSLMSFFACEAMFLLEKLKTSKSDGSGWLNAYASNSDEVPEKAVIGDYGALSVGSNLSALLESRENVDCVTF